MNALARLWAAGWTVRIAILVIVGVFVIAIAGPVLAPYDPLGQDTASALQDPSPAHLLGTDYLGRDVLSRLLAGAPASLLSAFGAMMVATKPTTISQSTTVPPVCPATSSSAPLWSASWWSPPAIWMASRPTSA